MNTVQMHEAQQKISTDHLFKDMRNIKDGPVHERLWNWTEHEPKITCKQNHQDAWSRDSGLSRPAFKWSPRLLELIILINKRSFVQKSDYFVFLSEKSRVTIPPHTPTHTNTQLLFDKVTASNGNTAHEPIFCIATTKLPQVATEPKPPDTCKHKSAEVLWMWRRKQRGQLTLKAARRIIPEPLMKSWVIFNFSSRFFLCSHQQLTCTAFKIKFARTVTVFFF